jgi:Delta3,5-Delta2,4-dienoyl-CoA isomerase
LIRELKRCFEQLQFDSECRSILISGSGKGFTAGIDLSELADIASSDDEDVGRKAFRTLKIVKDYQNSISSVEIVTPI